MKFAELLQIQTDDNQGMSYKATLLYFNWLKDRIANNVPMNQIVKELLTSKGALSQIQQLIITKSKEII